MLDKVKQIVRRFIRFYKTRIILAIFLSLILAGTGLLCLPAASRSGEGLPFLDALFTATSATCVTGLVVVDTYSHFTLFGQLVILALIQIGGLGFMSIATLFSLALRRTISYNQRLFIKETLNTETMQGLVRLMRHILLGTLTIELAGAACFAVRFVPQFGLAEGLYKAVFQSVSFFCNAGFDLMGQHEPFSSLTVYVTDHFVTVVTMALIVIGGIGFAVWEDVLNFRKRRRLSLHSKIVLWTSGVLIAAGAALFFVFEAGNPATMDGLTLPQKGMAALFQSVTTRTAGVNTIDLNAMTDSSKFVSVLLMFIGGSPGSTAGGVKTVTLFVLLAAAVAVVRGSAQVVAFRRRISIQAVLRAMSIVFLSLAVVLIVTLLLAQYSDAPFIDLLFEATSAFGTVGLSTGLTPGWQAVPKLALIVLMFFGRVGIFTVALSLTRGMNSGIPDKLKYPEEKIMIG